VPNAREAVRVVHPSVLAAGPQTFVVGFVTRWVNARMGAGSLVEGADTRAMSKAPRLGVVLAIVATALTSPGCT
jgi:hypothetical protein